MAASGPVALGIGGIASILLISGIKGKSLSEILQGDFGSPSNPSFSSDETNTSSSTGEAGTTTPASGTTSPTRSATTGADAPNPVTAGQKAIAGRRAQELATAERVVRRDFPSWNSKQVTERAKILVKANQQKIQ